MAEDGLLLEDAEPFENLMEQCAELAKRANRAAGSVVTVWFSGSTVLDLGGLASTHRLRCR